MATKTKIVLDADVIIHFIKGCQFSLLLDIFPEYEYLILDVVIILNETSVCCRQRKGEENGAGVPTRVDTPAV